LNPRSSGTRAEKVTAYRISRGDGDRLTDEVYE
jgi:hypothetical protein